MQKSLSESKIYSPFWICLFVFIALGVDSGIRFYNLMGQRRQLDAANANQAQNATRLAQIIAQRQQIEPRLQALSMDLLQIAQTNGPARQIVQEFNIQWAPPPQPPQPPPAPPAK